MCPVLLLLFFFVCLFLSKKKNLIYRFKCIIVHIPKNIAITRIFDGIKRPFKDYSEAPKK